MVESHNLGYARFPLAQVEPQGRGYEVRLRDMRFASELPGRRGIIAVIDLNAQSLVIGERLEFDGSPTLWTFDACEVEQNCSRSFWGLPEPVRRPRRIAHQR